MQTTRDNQNQPQAVNPPPQHNDPSVPILLQHGFNGGIESWNQRVQKVHDAFMAKNGTPPPPGLVFDVARSPVHDNHITHLADVPMDPRTASVKAAYNQDRLNGKVLSQRPDGMYDPHNWWKETVPHIPHDPNARFKTYKEFYGFKNGLFRYVMFGGIPGIPARDTPAKLLDMRNTTNNSPYVAKYGNSITPDQAANIIKNSMLSDTTQPGRPVDVAATQKKVAAELAQGMSPSQIEQGLPQEVRPAADQLALAKSVVSVYGLQQYLQKIAPDHFVPLKATGYMTPDWIRKFGSWTRSVDYGMQYMKDQAKANHFPDNLQGIIQMNETKDYQQSLMNSSKLSDLGQRTFIEAMPLRVLYKAKWTQSVFKDPGQTLSDVWGYMNDSNSHAPVYRQLQDAFHLVQLGFDISGGVFNQMKSDMLGMTTVGRKVIKDLAEGKPLTRDDIAQITRNALEENPTWVKILSGGAVTSKNEPGWAKALDAGSNFLIDLWIGTKWVNKNYNPIAHDLDTAMKHPAIWGATKLSYNAAKSGDFRQAIRDLHGGRSPDPGFMRPEQLIAKVGPKIQAGKMSFEEYHKLIANAYAKFEVTIDGEKYPASVLDNFASGSMPNLTRRGLYIRQAVRAVGSKANEITREALSKPTALRKAEATAVKMARFLPGVYYATPAGVKEIYAAHFPAQLHAFIRNQDLASLDDTNKIVNKFIIARANNDTARLHGILQSVYKAFREKYPAKPGSIEPNPFSSELETELLSRFNFPVREKVAKSYENVSAQEKENVGQAAEMLGIPGTVAEFGHRMLLSAKLAKDEPLAALQEMTYNVNEVMNRVFRIWRAITLSKNVGRFWKHLTRDSIAAKLGGWTPIRGALSDSMAEANIYMKQHPDVFRLFSATRGRTTVSELHWLSNEQWVDGGASWNLGDYLHLHSIKAIGKQAKNLRVRSATEYIRKMLNSDAYEAFLKSSKDNVKPLEDLILSNPRGMQEILKIQARTRKDVSAMEEHQKQLALLSPGENMDEVLMARAGQLNSKKFKTPRFEPSEDITAKEARYNQIKLEEAHKWAKHVYQRFAELQKAVNGSSAGRTGLDEMWHIIHSNPGLADSELGKFLEKHQIPVEVRDGTLIRRPGLDQLSESIISKWMYPNFIARNKLFDSQFAQVYRHFRQAGLDERQSIIVAAHSAEQITMKHMLDFRSQLEFEQRFRWLLPFFTKHRLYVGWLGSILRQRPGLSLAVSDIGQMIDHKGNINFDIGGHHMRINVLRMMWLTTEDQPVTLPYLDMVPGIGHGNPVEAFLGGSGAGVIALYKAATVHTYEDAIKGLKPSEQHQLQRRMISMGIRWEASHPGQPIPESHIVKMALLEFANTSFVNDTMVSPVLYQSAQLPQNVVKLHDQYLKLLADNPGKAANFLEKNPQVGLAFGQYQDTHVYWHNQDMFGKLRALGEERQLREKPIIDKFLADGNLTSEDIRALRAVSTWYGNQYNQLLLEDAKSWGELVNRYKLNVPGFPAGKIAKGADGKEYVVTPGPFGVGADMSGQSQQIVDWIEKFTNIPKKDLWKVWSSDQQTQQNFLDRVKSYITDPVLLNDVEAALNQNLKPFRDQSKDRGAQILSAYFDQRSQWLNNAQKVRDQLKNASGIQKQQLEDQLREMDARAMLDSSFKFEGKSYKSVPFPTASYYDKPQPQRVQWFIKNLMNSSYNNLSSADKMILGLKNTNPLLDAAWIVYHQNLSAYVEGRAQGYKGPVSGYKQYYAAQVSKIFAAHGVPGFMQDWLNTQKPKFELIQQYKPLQESSYASDWNDLLKLAQTVYIRDRGSSSTNIQRDWQYNWVPKIVDALDQFPPGFQQELKLAGGERFLKTLVSKG